jgi:hypothetical protein
MRVAYLLTILFLILFMSYEFNWIAGHYDYLGAMADLTVAKVKFLESRCTFKK